ncbi:MAG: arginine--tRNA ligase, partial [Clostridiales bacterium]|nr:arginine--tRNA ligase [Clostridiales bacterium]
MNKVGEIKEIIRDAVTGALHKAIHASQLPDAPLPAYVIDTPRDRSHGDFAVNVAMLMSKPAKMAPREIAQIIAGHIRPDADWLERVEIAGPGFLNFYLSPAFFHPVVGAILAEGPTYGSSDYGNGRRVQIEFVSANPTGLLHMGNARGAALGDSLANIMGAAGYAVSKEYYINDAGNQIENFGLS